MNTQTPAERLTAYNTQQAQLKNAPRPAPVIQREGIVLRFIGSLTKVVIVLACIAVALGLLGGALWVGVAAIHFFWDHS
jgi:hypothetical protein